LSPVGADPGAAHDVSPGSGGAPARCDEVPHGPDGTPVCERRALTGATQVPQSEQPRAEPPPERCAETVNHSPEKHQHP
jgi:hypothetical protein